jgi:hypothetical protein
MSAREQDLRQELTCPICMELLRNPVSLVPCQHTFCELCIVPVLQAAVAQQQAHCPVCRTVTEMACQSHLARNASALLSTSTPRQYEHVPSTGLRAFAHAPTGKRKAIFQVVFNLYPYETLSFYGPDHAAEMADALSRNATIRTALFCELGSLQSRFVVAALHANRCVFFGLFCVCVCAWVSPRPCAQRPPRRGVTKTPARMFDCPMSVRVCVPGCHHGGTYKDHPQIHHQGVLLQLLAE